MPTRIIDGEEHVYFKADEAHGRVEEDGLLIRGEDAEGNCFAVQLSLLELVDVLNDVNQSIRVNRGDEGLLILWHAKDQVVWVVTDPSLMDEASKRALPAHRAMRRDPPL